MASVSSSVGRGRCAGVVFLGDIMAATDVYAEPARVHQGQCLFLGTPFDMLDQTDVLNKLDECRPDIPFRYIVTPNVDYVVRMSKDRELRQCVEAAWLSLCDSRPIAALARLSSIRLPLVTGSDLTAELFRSVIRPGDAVTLVASSDDVVRRMQARYPDLLIRSVVPPMGVRDDPRAMQACVNFVVEAGSRFVFLAIGSPQSEMIAHRLMHHPAARGVGLNVGASLEFLVGTRRRAPRWMRQAGIEWLHRLMSDPRRLWRRYVYGAVPLIRLFLIESRLPRHPVQVKHVE